MFWSNPHVLDQLYSPNSLCRIGIGSIYSIYTVGAGKWIWEHRWKGWLLFTSTEREKRQGFAAIVSLWESAVLFNIAQVCFILTPNWAKVGSGALLHKSVFWCWEGLGSVDAQEDLSAQVYLVFSDGLSCTPNRQLSRWHSFWSRILKHYQGCSEGILSRG